MVAESARKGERLLDRMRAAAQIPIVGDVRRLGLIVGVEFVRDQESKKPFANLERITWRVMDAAFQRGILVYPATGMADGSRGDAILMGPPLNIDEGDLDLLAGCVLEAIASVDQEVPEESGSLQSLSGPDSKGNRRCLRRQRPTRTHAQASRSQPGNPSPLIYLPTFSKMVLSDLSYAQPGAEWPRAAQEADRVSDYPVHFSGPPALRQTGGNLHEVAGWTDERGTTRECGEQKCRSA